MARSSRRRAVRLGQITLPQEAPVQIRRLFVAAVVVAVLPVGAFTQDTSEVSARPRTAWGAPDLEGVWVSNSATPLERPAALSDRPQLTAAEVATLQARATRIFANGRSAYAPGDTAFGAALDDVETFHYPATSSSIGMIDRVFDERTSLVVDPPSGRIPRVMEAGRRRQMAADLGWEKKTGPEDMNNINRCLTPGVPRLGGNFGAGPYSYYQIVQTADHVVVVMEAFHDARIIPLDGRPELPDRIRQLNGAARGRWMGDTLVVDTRNFALQSYFRGASAGLRLVERFSRTADDILVYRVTVRDPTTWTTAWTAEMPLRRSDQPIYEFACHEGNRSLLGMLTTARLEEARSPGAR